MGVLRAAAGASRRDARERARKWSAMQGEMVQVEMQAAFVAIVGNKMQFESDGGRSLIARATLVQAPAAWKVGALYSLQIRGRLGTVSGRGALMVVASAGRASSVSSRHVVSVEAVGSPHE